MQIILRSDVSHHIGSIKLQNNYFLVDYFFVENNKSYLEGELIFQKLTF